MGMETIRARSASTIKAPAKDKLEEAIRRKEAEMEAAVQ